MRVQSVLCRELAAMSGKQKTFTVAHGQPELLVVIAESEREGTRAETRIGLSAKRTIPFKSAGGSVQSTSA